MRVSDIAIYGAGGYGREVACLINRINSVKLTWNLIGFIDDGIETGREISHFGKTLGGINELNKYADDLAIVMAIGSPQTVKDIVNNIYNSHIYFPNLIAPDFEIADDKSFEIGKGNIIQSKCFVSCDVKVGDFNTLNGSVTLSHDNNIGSFNTFMPGVRVSGEVEIGDCNFFGVESIILQQIKIGSNVKLGAGSVLMRRPKDGQLYIGNPAKIFKY